MRNMEERRYPVSRIPTQNPPRGGTLQRSPDNKGNRVPRPLLRARRSALPNAARSGFGRGTDSDVLRWVLKCTGATDT